MQRVSFKNASFELLEEGSYILVEGTPESNFDWDSANDNLRFKILQFMQQYRTKKVRYTEPLIIEGRFEMHKGKDGTWPIFMIDSFQTIVD